MIDGSEKRNRQLAFELQNSHVCEKRSNVVPGLQGLLFRDETSYDFFLGFFFSIRPTDPISGNAFDAKRRKRGMA